MAEQSKEESPKEAAKKPETLEDFQRILMDMWVESAIDMTLMSASLVPMLQQAVNSGPKAGILTFNHQLRGIEEGAKLFHRAIERNQLLSELTALAGVDKDHPLGKEAEKRVRQKTAELFVSLSNRAKAAQEAAKASKPKQPATQETPPQSPEQKPPAPSGEEGKKE